MLVAKMAAASPLWGAPRIHGELSKLGLQVSERTVSRLPPSGRVGTTDRTRPYRSTNAVAIWLRSTQRIS
jgi:hypothetical protein